MKYRSPLTPPWGQVTAWDLLDQDPHLAANANWLVKHHHHLLPRILIDALSMILVCQASVVPQTRDRIGDIDIAGISADPALWCLSSPGHADPLARVESTKSIAGGVDEGFNARFQLGELDFISLHQIRQSMDHQTSQLFDDP